MTKLTGILGGVMAATMFGAIAIGATAALYTSEKTVNVHLYSGNLSAEFYLTSIVRDEFGPTSSGYILDNDVDLSGYQGYDQVNQRVDLSVFQGSIFSDILLAPGMTGTATFLLKNTGDVPFNFSVALTNLNLDPAQTGTESTEFYEDMVFTLPSESVRIAPNSEATFSVSYEFRDDGVDQHGVGLNNDAMNQQFSCDVSVLCTQVAIERNQG